MGYNIVSQHVLESTKPENVMLGGYVLSMDSGLNCSPPEEVVGGAPTRHRAWEANSARRDVRTSCKLLGRWSQGLTREIRLTLKTETVVDDAVEAFLPEALELVSRPRLSGSQRQ